MIKNENNILLFDGICNLCNRLVQFIIKRDPKAKFRFAALQSKRGQDLLMQMKLPMDDLNSIVYIRGGKHFLKSSAILYVLKDLSGVWKLFYVFIIMPPIIRDAIYEIVARTRYKVFGKRRTCMIPSPDVIHRFIE